MCMHTITSHPAQRVILHKKKKLMTLSFYKRKILVVSDQVMEDHGCHLEIGHIFIDLLYHRSTPKILNGTVMNKNDDQSPCESRHNDYDRSYRWAEIKVRRREYISSDGYQLQALI